MRIHFGKAEGEWASLNEVVGRGDGKRTAWETPFPAKEARGLHVMRNLMIVSAENKLRVLDGNGDFKSEEVADGYQLSVTGPDAPVTITFDKPVPLGHFVSVSVLGRCPEKGEAIKVMPMTDAISKQLDEKIPPELRKRKREMNVALEPIQNMYREAYNRLVLDFHGFNDEVGEPLTFTEPVKKAILDNLGCSFLGPFVMDRANELQKERASGRKSELSD